MAFSKDQRESSLPTGNNVKKTAVDFLPRYFRTATNQKFLNATVDQLIDEGSVEKINAFIGRKTAKAYSINDRYLGDVSADREAYQLEPGLLIKDNLENVTFFKDYRDYINQLDFFNSDNTDHNKINSQEYYSWNPNINWDKFINYREYYWLPTGPQAIPVAGQTVDITSTYTVTLSEEVDNRAYLFTPDGLTRNPNLKLYRGQTYRFIIDCPGHPMAFSTSRTYIPEPPGTLPESTDLGPFNSYTIWNQGVVSDTTYVEKGVIEFTVPENAPNLLYYVSKNDINTSGIFQIYDITEATKIDVEKEILGKKTYALNDEIDLSNGMKLYFIGQVTPEKYATGYWYVEGVGDKITLIAERDLETPAVYTVNEAIEFDNENFDTQGFDVNNNFPGTKDYITINRGSRDRNFWSRYNRWFHRTVIENSAVINDEPVSIDQSARATRPIIEFDAGLQLWNFGNRAKQNVDLIDTFTTDVFSTIEGSLGYNIDGVQLVEGYRVLFTADTDSRVSGRIYRVKFINHLNVKRLTLIPESDSSPIEGETILVLDGLVNRGKMYHYRDGFWKTGQTKTKINQPPLFDVFDTNGISYGDKSVYVGSSFLGTTLFTYKAGTNYDQELEMNIAYRNIGNIGDILFNFDLHTDTFTYQTVASVKTISLDNGYLKKYDITTSLINGWIQGFVNSKQYVVRQYDITLNRNFLLIDVYDNSGNLTDLEVKVQVNGVKKGILDFEIYRQDGQAYVRFFEDLKENDIVVIKTNSSAPKNENGYYEFPSNFESNPQNLSLNDFTLGEIINHTQTIVENSPDFVGAIPGISNLRDIGQVSQYGTKIIQHSSPLIPIVYHITNKDFNIIKSLRYAKTEYSKFKRNFLRVAESYGYDGNIRDHLDLVLKETVKDKTQNMPYHLSDMIPCGGNFIFNQTIIDNSTIDFPLTFDFNLDTLSEKAVLVYLNEQQLIYKKDYIFVNDNFVRILKPIAGGDDLKIIQYEKTDGCYVPPTPTKLGMYPKYEPRIYIDNTYQTPTKVIQGHDGSIVIAFDDFRDDLLLEFERRIYNNIKINYDEKLFDLYNFVPGYFRNSDLTQSELNNVLRQDFLTWTSLITDDYTKHSFHDRNNEFTFNYKNFTAFDSVTPVPGFWRGIYKWAYDTDRPHTHPWEMLGFSEKPSWWEEVYGPAPYTKENLILWRDLRDGTIREPGKYPIINVKFARPTLLSHLPVDSDGNLLSPINSAFIKNFVSVFTENQFTFGDQAVVETAWRRSSEYPFALITALTLLRPAKIFSTCFDRFRQIRDNTGQIVYRLEDGNLRFNTSNLIFPNIVTDTNRSFTSGLINYVIDYAISKSLSSVETYKENLKNLKVNLASKLGGFTTKEKFRLILDSRTPMNQGNVFIPYENYQIILNTSAPVKSAVYSGVIIEKQPTGFIIRGYNNSVPEFKYYSAISTVSDPIINVGGISEEFVEWDSDKYYTKNQVVKYDNNYYRTSAAHTSSAQFELKYFTKLASLPIEGGRDIIIRSRFDEDFSTLHYGAELKTVQDVVDFLLGYGQYLIDDGFTFEYYNSELKTITDWQTSVKEFAFWTTQNWSAGSVITLSPSADELIYQQDYAVIDNIYDIFYDYSILKQDGNVLEPSFTNSVREKNSFTLRPRNTTDGIYHAKLNLVQKEHVLILDDITVFNDVIYDQRQGYHQERIKILGYRTVGWQGDFDAPGFVYDRALVSDWTPWKDYALGETVKYKEFYYSAKFNIPGTEKFESNDWYKLNDRPESQLLPNWDYRARQFADFYDLDTDSFDIEQQKFAQHLIGYQKRQYLENIINDDVSQYKFYQGMIQEKGTKNSLSRLFDILSSIDDDSLNFYEEWAIRLGQYGGSDAFNEVEFILDENKFFINPQPFELVNDIDPTLNDFVYRIKPNEVYIKPEGYNHEFLPISNSSKEYLKTAGFVRSDDVQYILKSINEILEFDINALREGDYFWVGYDKNSWNVYRFTKINATTDFFEAVDDGIKIKINENEFENLKYIGIRTEPTTLEGFYQIIRGDSNYIVIGRPETISDNDIESLNDSTEKNYFKLTSQKIQSIDELDSLNLVNKKNKELVWVTNQITDWQVWGYSNSYERNDINFIEPNFGKNIVVNGDDTIMVISGTNKVLFYKRPSENFLWVYNDQLTPSSTGTFLTTDGTFGQTISLTADTGYLAVGAPGYSDDLIAEPNKGYVAIYSQDAQGYFTFIRTVVSPVNVSGEFFGFKVAALKNLLIVVSKGSPGVDAAITLFDLDDGQLITRETFLGVEITDISVSDNETIVVGTNDEKVYVYNLEGTNSLPLTLTQTLSFNGDLEEPFGIETGSNFASAVAIEKNANTIAVGIPLYSDIETAQGAVLLYQLIENLYVPSKLLKPISPKDSEKFGSRLVFNTDSDQLVVYSAGGTIKNNTTFDTFKEKLYSLTPGAAGTTTFPVYIAGNFVPGTQYKIKSLGSTDWNVVAGTVGIVYQSGDQFIAAASGSGSGTAIKPADEYILNPNSGERSEKTTFDLNTTNFIETENYSGSVKIFDKYKNEYVFADELKVLDPIGNDFGLGITVTNKIYVGDPGVSQGAVYEFYSNNKSWSLHRTPENIVDLKKIKSIFLYNIKTNELVKYIDYVDPVQGKILGIAEQEISFKTFFDPATYSVGTDDVVVDSLMSWKKQNVGKLWWDLEAVKMINPYQGTALYKANTWNNLFSESSIDVYEWVESEFLPSEWDDLADTEEGLTLGVSGKSKYGNLVYSFQKYYDNVSGNFKNLYYFWVKNKTIVPDIEGRKISANEVSEYISDPKSKGVQYITLLDKNQFALVNCNEIILNQDIAINFRYWVVDNTDINIHSHYQLLADGDDNLTLNRNIEQKWFDSLIGYDLLDNEIPDPRLPAKLKYGILSKPRQSMFINRLEALKQFIERVNSVLKTKSIIDDYNISALNSRDPEPSIYANGYDAVSETYSQLRFIGTANIRSARLSPTIENGKIISVTIVDSGKGYGKLLVKENDVNGVPIRWAGPNIKIIGSGRDAEISTIINSRGEIIAIEINNAGIGYSNDTILIVRPFTSLVLNDETSNNKWALYTLNTNKTWFKSKTQTYDTTKYWEYVDWFAPGYSLFSKIDHTVDYIYQLPVKTVEIGEIVKISNHGSSGWLLLEKIDDQNTLETIINYKVIGRQKGTIQFKSNLYKFSNNNVGFDGPTFDADVYDEQPKEELRIILKSIKEDLFVDEFSGEYNKLFFASLRYVFSEQQFVDWAFKTSFVKSRHNLGELQQRITYQNDNLSDYENYINEVKPYRSKIREFVSNYKKIDETKTLVSDFDLPARYDKESKQIKPFGVWVKGSIIEYDSAEILNSPYSDWYTNVGNEISNIVVSNGGSGYKFPPVVEITGVCSRPASARAYVSRGRISTIVLDDPGAGYITTPVVRLLGSVEAGGEEATASAILDKSLIRNFSVEVKFDRTAPKYTVSDINVTQQFSGTGSRVVFELKWPIDIRSNNVSIVVSNEEKLSSEFVVYNKLDTFSAYTRYIGILEFSNPPISGSNNIVIKYQKNISLLNAADRIKYFYPDSPKPGKIGKDLGQLMDGVDYGGVEITGIEFDIGSGWDALPWFTTGWDNFDPTFSDYLVKSNGIQRNFNLEYVPADGEIITIYHQGVRASVPFYVRLDDVNYDLITNLNSEIVVLTGEISNLQNILEGLQTDKLNQENLIEVISNSLESLQNQYNIVSAQFAVAVPFTPLWFSLQAQLGALTSQIDTTTANLVVQTAQLNLINNNIEETEDLIAEKELQLDSTETELENSDPLINEDAVMNSFIGDGSTNGPITIPLSVSIADGDFFTFRKSTSDGSFKPDPKFYDTEILGGDLAYTTAKGILSEDINIDGDGFITPTSSHAPEEVVPGRIVDTVDIQVYHKVSDGAPIIVTRFYESNGVNNTFVIGQRPASSNSVFVMVNRSLQKQGEDYTVDFVNQTVTLNSTAAVGSKIVVVSMSQNGLDILALDFFIGDGSTTEFITAARWNDNYSFFATVDGETYPVTTFITDDSYNRPNNIGIRFFNPPEENSIINYVILGSALDSISRVQTQTIVHDGSSSVYNLTIEPKFLGPTANSVIVATDGKVLRPADTIYFDVVGNNRTFLISNLDYANSSITTADIEVYLNGIKLNLTTDYSWSVTANELRIRRGVASAGDRLAVFIKINAQYLIVNNQITFLDPYLPNTEINVTTFTNHDILDVERSNTYIKTASALVEGTVDYFSYNAITQGKIKLSRPVLSADYVWVSLNNDLLVPNVDYILENNLEYIKIDSNLNLEQTDVIDVISFSGTTIKNSFGYRIFKDMLNKSTYQRINDANSTVLSQPLKYYDLTITVENGEDLPDPVRSQNQSGVVIIESERIEYLKKEGNVLSQLRRGTMGTGVKSEYSIGTLVRDVGIDQIVPYKDEITSSMIISDGSSEIIPLNFVPMKDHIENGGSFRTVADWIDDGFSSDFPEDYIQADDIEVFLGGKRLRKIPSIIWNNQLGPDSPSGDIKLDAEFAVDGVTQAVKISESAFPVDEEGNRLPVTITVQKRIGRAWAPISISLVDSNYEEAKFLRAKPANLPE